MPRKSVCESSAVRQSRLAARDARRGRMSDVPSVDPSTPDAADSAQRSWCVAERARAGIAGLRPVQNARSFPVARQTIRRNRPKGVNGMVGTRDVHAGDGFGQGGGDAAGSSPRPGAPHDRKPPRRPRSPPPEPIGSGSLETRRPPPCVLRLRADCHGPLWACPAPSRADLVPVPTADQ